MLELETRLGTRLLNRTTRRVSPTGIGLAYYDRARRVLLDAEMDAPVVAEIVEVIEQGPVAAEIVDFHVWRVGRGKYACILSLLVEEQVEPEQFKERLSVHDELVHVTVEVNQRPQLEAGA